MSFKYSTALLRRFARREDLGKTALYDMYFKPEGLNEKEVMACFEEIELSYGIPVGVLRPDDSLTKLTSPVTTSNPLKWLWWIGERTFSEDSLLEELGLRMRKHGILDSWENIDSFGDLVRAWCGRKPDTLQK